MDKKGNILLVEDDVSIGSLLFDLIKGHGYGVKWAKNGVEGLQQLSKAKFTCLLLDIMMPEKNGYEMLRELRAVYHDLPVLILTAKSEIEDKRQAFQLGADDYVVKPFEWEELALRIDAQHRNKEQTPQIIAFSTASFDPSKQEIYFSDGSSKRLTGRESHLFGLLITQQNKVVDRSHILNLVWGVDSYQNSRSLDVFISRLRSYIKEIPGVEIHNIHGKGYELSVKNE